MHDLLSPVAGYVLRFLINLPRSRLKKGMAIRASMYCCRSLINISHLSLAPLLIKEKLSLGIHRYWNPSSALSGIYRRMLISDQ